MKRFITYIKNRYWDDSNGTDITFDTDEYANIATKSEIHRDVYTTRSYRIPLICSGKSGVYVFVISQYVDMKHLREIYGKVCQTLGFGTGVYTFIRCLDADYFVSGGKFIKIEYLLDKFENLYQNNLRPQTELMQLGFCNELEMLEKPDIPEGFQRNTSGHVVDKVSSAYLCQLKKRTDNLARNRSARTKVIEKDGLKYVKHPITKLGMIISENYFPVSDEDPWRFLLLTVFGGIFGLHRFKTAEYVKGFIYMFTCGLFGIGYITDIFSILTGTYYVTQTSYECDKDSNYSQESVRIYLDTLDWKHRLYGILLMILGTFLVYLAYRFIYHPILHRISTVLLEYIQSKAV